MAEPQQDQGDIHTAAMSLAKYNQEAEPAIVRSYLFPSNTEIRLIHLDEHSPAMREGDDIAPFYFGRSSDVPYPSAIALIRPEEKERLTPPAGWGEWEEAEELVPETR